MKAEPNLGGRHSGAFSGALRNIELLLTNEAPPEEQVSASVALRSAPQQRFALSHTATPPVSEGKLEPGAPRGPARRGAGREQLGRRQSLGQWEVASRGGSALHGREATPPPNGSTAAT